MEDTEICPKCGKKLEECVQCGGLFCDDCDYDCPDCGFGQG